MPTWPALASILLVALQVVAPAGAEEHAFRIRFGLTDTQPTSWSGSATVTGGDITRLRSWRPRGADEIDGTSWKLASAPGVKFRYRNWEPEPPFPVPSYLNLPGLILTVEADADARVDIATSSGNLSFRLSEQPVRHAAPLPGGGCCSGARDGLRIRFRPILSQRIRRHSGWRKRLVLDSVGRIPRLGQLRLRATP